MFEFIIIYLITIAISFFIFRECVRNNKSSFAGVDFKDIALFSVLVTIPLFNILISWRLNQLLKGQFKSYEELLEKVFFI
jgi:hypothetical protein